MMTPREEFGEYLRLKRVEAGLTQKQVSDKLKLKSPQSISNVERGLAPAPIKMLKVLIQMYRIDEGEILHRLIALQVDQLERQLYGT